MSLLRYFLVPLLLISTNCRSLTLNTKHRSPATEHPINAQATRVNRVDYALLISNVNKVFIEAKRMNENPEAPFGLESFDLEALDRLMAERMRRGHLLF